jgi:hypothetical protein
MQIGIYTRYYTHTTTHTFPALALHGGIITCAERTYYPSRVSGPTHVWLNPHVRRTAGNCRRLGRLTPANGRRVQTMAYTVRDI